MKKCCKHCGITKQRSDFYADSAARDGRRPECKACTAARRKRWYEHNRAREIARVKTWQDANREHVLETRRKRRSRPDVKQRERAGYLRRTFGITPEEYDHMLRAQRGRCAICRRRPRRDISLHVDHDHTTGAIRGLLCFRCNNALGDLGDSPEVLARARAYLDEHDPEQQELAAAARRRLAALRA